MARPTVRALHVYPVKGCRGVSLERAIVEHRGLRHDRRWMIVDDAGRFLTQREHAGLARVDAIVDPGGLTLGVEGKRTLRVPRPDDGSPRMRVRVWQSDVDALRCGDEADVWLGAILGVRVHLVFMPDDAQRDVDPAYGRAGDVVSFADGYPVLVATEASLADLNRRLEAPVPMDRFRPNVVLSGTAAWAEDGWRVIRIGDVTMRVVKRCGRCVVTTIDQRTGAQGAEPLRTLATFRRHEGSVAFAQNCIPDTIGTLKVGDPVEVLA